jgi:hypothetical protein
MANSEHLEILKLGVEIWNKWRKENPTVNIDLMSADLFRADLSGADFHDADLRRSNLREANLSSANLSKAQLYRCNLNRANLTKANLSYADLDRAYISRADLSGADLNGANMQQSVLVETKLEGAILCNAKVYGISAWNLNLNNAIEKDLIITKDDEPVITVDDMAVAQFIYLLLNNKNIRNVLNSITSKGVLILGRFSDPQRKAVLDGLREKLRNFDLLPILFDFDRPTDKDYTETVQTLAGMSMFVIADLTNPKSTPLELEATVKNFKIPYVPIIDISVDPHPFAMLADLQKSFHWVLPTLGYKSCEQLLKDEVIKKYIIEPVNKKRGELRNDKNNELGITMITEIDADSLSQ